MLPKLFIERLKKIIPSEKLASVLHSFEQTKKPTFRVNTLKIHIAEIRSLLQQENIQAYAVNGFDNAFTVDVAQRDALTHSGLHSQGKIYIQNLSSMLAPLILNPQPGEEVLDLTAAPGSKTSQMAMLMQNQGRIAAVEKSKTRFFKLKDSLEKQGVTCAKLYHRDGATVWRHCRHRFDRVLLDVPCSSETRFSLRDPESYQYWSEKKIKSCARMQWLLLYSAFQSLKPGGTMVYSTCSFAPEENEFIIAKLLKKFPNQITLKKIVFPIENTQPGLTQWSEKHLPKTLCNTVRILPNEIMNGFYLTHLQKRVIEIPNLQRCCLF